jgi:hypothetical protein
MQMRATTANVQTKPPAPNYSPSVPVYVYRELVAELQAVQAKLDVVTGHNQKLSQENQQLRQEIKKVVQSCLELQQLLDASTPSSPSAPRNNEQKNIPVNQGIPKAEQNAKNNVKNTPNPQPKQRKNTENKPKNQKKVKAAPPPRQPTPKTPQKIRREVVSVPVIDMNFPVSEPMLIEEQEVHYYLPLESESKGLNGWWLLLTIVFIMISGFGAGYLVVRPLLQNQSHHISQ